MYATLSDGKETFRLKYDNSTGCFSAYDVQEYLTQGFDFGGDMALVILSLIGLGLAGIFCAVYMVDAFSSFIWC